MQNISKTHEKNVQSENQTENVDNIIGHVENVPYALRGSKVKTILYWLFGVIAALELTAALFFYVSSIGTAVAVALVGAVAIAFSFHGLLHSILTDTMNGLVFAKMRESKAMNTEVKTNLVLTICLLVIAALAVFFIGKKGFTAYRGKQYEIAQNEGKPKEAPKGLNITADMLTNKKGKITQDKLEQLANVTNAAAKQTDATTHAASADRELYDATTAQMTDIVGASAFVLELLLALLAFSIATAKYAAVIEEMARRKGGNNPSLQQEPKTEPIEPKDMGAKADAPTLPKRQWSDYPIGSHKGLIAIWLSDCDDKFKSEFDAECFEIALDIVNPYVYDGEHGITFSQDVLTTYNKLCQKRKAQEPVTVTQEDLTASVTDAVTTRKQIGFSENKVTKTGNEGRAIIQGFQRKNEEKASVTASVTANVTDAVDKNIKMCLHCEKEYVYRIHNQKYCCEECRIAAWEEKNNAKLRKVKTV